MQFLAEMMDNGLLAASFCVTFEQGKYENEMFFIDISIPCTDPTCNCGIVKFKAKGFSEDKKGEEYNYYLSIETRNNPNNKIREVQKSKDIIFSKAFINELNENNWDELTTFYYANKELLTEKLRVISDLDFYF